MPFTATLEAKSGDYQLFSVGIDSVDPERDRLAIVLEDVEDKSAIVCSLENGEDGRPWLRIDREHSDRDFIETLDEGLRDELDVERPEELAVYVVTDLVSDSSDLMLTVPPTVAVEIGDEWAYNDFEPEEGDIVYVESRAIN